MSADPRQQEHGFKRVLESGRLALLLSNKERDIACTEDRRVTHVKWVDALVGSEPRKTSDNRFICWCGKGVLKRTPAGVLIGRTWRTVKLSMRC